MTAMQRWSVWFLLVCLAVVISYVWLDRPIASRAHDPLAHHEIFATATHIPEIIAPVLILAFAARRLRRRSRCHDFRLLLHDERGMNNPATDFSHLGH
jgi:hypothetical protein